MNGAQDLGGQMGFGPIELEDNEPNFHAIWEERAFALTLAMGATGSWTIDTSRFARETLPPVDYLSSSYYEIWTKGLEKLLLDKELVSEEELSAGQATGPARPVTRILAAKTVASTLAKGGPADRPETQPARFRIGDRVRTKRMNPEHHTRLPPLCPRRGRHNRNHPRCSRLSRHQCAWQGRAASMAVQRCLQGHGYLGNGQRSVAQSQDRPLGALS